jgi:hypothetical protein
MFAILGYLTVSGAWALINPWYMLIWGVLGFILAAVAESE